MNKYNETFGIDISKDVFDCYGSKQGHLQFKNNEIGFKKFLKILSKIVGILLLLFIILVLILSIPFVQTGLGNYVTSKLNDEFKTNINIDRVSMQFNGDIELKNMNAALLEKAFENGAKYAIIDNPEYKINDQCILVEDSLVCLQDLSKYHRQQLTNLKLIAIVGSNGKTTTKELVHSVLSSKYKTYSTYKNWNNEIGVPLNLLKLDETYDFAVIELGANHLEEHAFLCNIALPDYGIVTNCGKDHLEGYGSIEGVIQSNKELFDFVEKHKLNTKNEQQDNFRDGIKWRYITEGNSEKLKSLICSELT